MAKKHKDKPQGSKPKHPIHTHNPKTGKPHSPAKQKKVKKILDKGKEKALVLLFLPFTALAHAFLKRRGIKPGKTPQEVIVQVYNETKKKNFGLADAPQDVFDYSLTGGELGIIDQMGFSENEFGFVPITPAMVTTVIQFLKTAFDAIKAKKAAGQPLSKDEQAISDMAPQIEKDLSELKDKAAAVDAQAQKEAEKEAEAGEGSISIAGMHFSPMMLLGILLLIVLLFVFLRK